MKYDLYYYKTFGIKTKIKYLFDVKFEKKIKDSFKKDWKKYFSKNKNGLSKSRKKQFDLFLKKSQKEKDDQFTCHRVYIKYINKHIGYGVFAKKDIPRYTILAQYIGVMKLDKDIPDDNDSTFFVPEFHKYSIDAQNQGNWARFMNHSNIPNVVVWKYFLPDRFYFIFTAGHKVIKKHQQLTYSYGEHYWEEGDEISENFS